MPDTVTITKEQLRRAIVYGWTNCIPDEHISLDRVWEGLHRRIPDDVKTDGGMTWGYGLESLTSEVDRE